jgi:hypothetical protein
MSHRPDDGGSTHLWNYTGCTHPWNVSLIQPFSIFIPRRNPWNNFQVSGNSCIKIIISKSHGTLASSVSCRYNNSIIIVNALLSREWYFSVELLFWPTSSKNYVYFFSITISRGTPRDISRIPRVPRNPGLRNPGLIQRDYMVLHPRILYFLNNSCFRCLPFDCFCLTL